jgi:ribosome biogenesis protein Nip4
VVKGNDKKEEGKVRVRKSSKRISDVVSLCVRYKFATHILSLAGLTYSTVSKIYTIPDR